MEEKKDNGTKPIMNTFEEEKESFFSVKLIAVLIAIVILGVGTGYTLSKKLTSTSGLTLKNFGNSSNVPKGTTVGSNDMDTFKDTAEGELAEGGIDGEGQFHLVRPGGDSQNVYLTSSIVDLSKFLKRKVKVWGETNKAQHAGWLMDVGKLEVKN